MLLKFHGASHISSVNLIACTGTLCTIAKIRPVLMISVIDALKALHSNLPPTLTNSQVLSVRKQLKMQLLALLKHPASIERQSQIIQVLLELGCQESELKRTLPKLEKGSLQKKSKRPLESSSSTLTNKKSRLAEKSEELEIDHEALAEQKANAVAENQKFVLEKLTSIDQIIDLVISAIKDLPEQAPEQFLKAYAPIINLTVPQQLQKIADGLALQMAEKKVGPGAACFTKDPPTKPKEILKTVFEHDLQETGDEKDEDNAAKRLKETLERMRGQDRQAKAKKLKSQKTLQEITKPISKELKGIFLRHSVNRVLGCSPKVLYGKVGFKRNKILTVFGSTFLPSVRTQVFDYILDDFISRESLAFSWLFEEYSLLQGNFILYTYFYILD